MFVAARNRRFNYQAPFGAQISQRALNRGLVWLFLGNGLFWSKDYGWSAGTRSGAPGQVASRSGLAKGFGTLAVANTAYLNGPNLALTQNFLSIVTIYNAISTGGNALGRLFQPVVGTGTTGMAMFTSVGYKMTISREGALGQNQWGILGTLVTGQPQGFGVTMDQSVALNAPILYENGILASTSAASTPGGAYTTGTIGVTVGNRASDGARYWDGSIELEAIFDNENNGLTAAEHLEIYTAPMQFLLERPNAQFMLGGSPTPVNFSGTVGDQTHTQNVAGFNLALSSFFSGSLTPFTYTLQAGALPTGLSLGSSTGEITGTPTVVETQSGIVVRATDTGTNTADTNAFEIEITAPPVGGSLFRTNPGGNLGGLGSSGPFFQTPLQ